MGGFSLKLKTKQGHHVVNTLSADETIGNFKSKISELTRIPAENVNSYPIFYLWKRVPPTRVIP